MQAAIGNGRNDPRQGDALDAWPVTADVVARGDVDAIRLDRQRLRIDLA